jgi:hypothetical protein
MSETASAVRAYIADHPDFAEIGGRMLQEWERGAALSLSAA